MSRPYRVGGSAVQHPLFEGADPAMPKRTRTAWIVNSDRVRSIPSKLQATDELLTPPERDFEELLSELGYSPEPILSVDGGDVDASAFRALTDGQNTTAPAPYLVLATLGNVMEEIYVSDPLQLFATMGKVGELVDAMHGAHQLLLTEGLPEDLKHELELEAAEPR